MFSRWQNDISLSNLCPDKIYVVVEVHKVYFSSFMTRSLSYRNHFTDLQNMSKDWFLYDRDLKKDLH